MKYLKKYNEELSIFSRKIPKIIIDQLVKDINDNYQGHCDVKVNNKRENIIRFVTNIGHMELKVYMDRKLIEDETIEFELWTKTPTQLTWSTEISYHDIKNGFNEEIGVRGITGWIQNVIDSNKRTVDDKKRVNDFFDKYPEDLIEDMLGELYDIVDVEYKIIKNESLMYTGYIITFKELKSNTMMDYNNHNAKMEIFCIPDNKYTSIMKELNSMYNRLLEIGLHMRFSMEGGLFIKISGENLEEVKKKLARR
jgi:hypothetical protein